MRLPGLAATALLVLGASLPTLATATEGDGIRIDVPVRLSEARVVLNLDHIAFDGDEPIGLQFLKVLVERFRAEATDWRIVAIFHGPNGYMALGDKRYDETRHWKHGNPYKDRIAALQAAGVEVELCAETMRLNGWRNADVLPGIKINTGANFRLIELAQQGFVAIQP